MTIEKVSQITIWKECIRRRRRGGRTIEFSQDEPEHNDEMHI